MNLLSYPPGNPSDATANAKVVNRLATADPRAKRTPVKHPFVRFSVAILPSWPRLLMSRQEEAEVKNGRAFSGRQQGLFLTAVSVAA
jgi:hypothetical protein